MANAYDKMKERGIALLAPPPKGGIYTPVHEFGTNLLYCSGCGPDLGGSTIIGGLGRDPTAKERQKVAYNRAPNLLASTEARIGDLNKIERFVKILAFVDSTDDFVRQLQIVNGVSSLLVELFGGEIGCLVYSAIGIDALPGGIACGTEALLEVETQSVFHPITEYNVFGILSL